MSTPVCPICNKDQVATTLHCQDFSLTQATFDIIKCANCGFNYTHPIPSIEDIATYYNFPAYISHTDVNEGWMNKLYHKVRKRTLQQKTDWVQSLFTGHKGQILEIGAGTGAFANSMTVKGWNVTALEPNEASRAIALQNYNINLLPIEALGNLQSQKFDVITLWHVLEHVHDLKHYLLEFNRLLKPNGRLIIAVPNYTSFDAKFYKKYWAAYDVPRHLYHFSPKSMRKLCNLNQMQILQYKPMWFDSFYVSLLSEKYMQSGKFGILRAFVIGCISNLYAWRNPKKASSVIYEIRKIS
jgi:2-polyprenyl-3-methyl-5-hydroxy-6-metoxy-1,4-benzoquinol methylase